MEPTSGEATARRQGDTDRRREAAAKPTSRSGSGRRRQAWRIGRPACHSRHAAQPSRERPTIRAPEPQERDGLRRSPQRPRREIARCNRRSASFPVTRTTARSPCPMSRVLLGLVALGRERLDGVAARRLLEIEPRPLVLDYPAGQFRPSARVRRSQSPVTRSASGSCSVAEPTSQVSYRAMTASSPPGGG